MTYTADHHGYRVHVKKRSNFLNYEDFFSFSFVIDYIKLTVHVERSKQFDIINKCIFSYLFPGNLLVIV